MINSFNSLSEFRNYFKDCPFCGKGMLFEVFGRGDKKLPRYTLKGDLISFKDVTINCKTNTFTALYNKNLNGWLIGCTMRCVGDNCLSYFRISCVTLTFDSVNSTIDNIKIDHSIFTVVEGTKYTFVENNYSENKTSIVLPARDYLEGVKNKVIHTPHMHFDYYNYTSMMRKIKAAALLS